jgi:hypothetical protein
MIQEWLIQLVTVEEAERLHLVSDPRLGVDPLPFGFKHAEWCRLAGNMLPDDELWLFEVPPDARDEDAGRKGVALVRTGEVVGQVIVRQICL